MDDEIEEAMRRLQRNFIRGYYEAPLSQRINPGDVLEGLHGPARGLRVTVVGPSDVGGWIVSDGSRSGHVTPESISSWRLVESAPMPVVETMIVPHEQAQAAREYLGAKYGVPHATRYTESPPADALNRWESRRHNAHCTRCYGPAFHGAGALRCERVGGCLADVEPKVDAIDASADLRDAAPDADVWEMSGRENYWLADGCDGRYATRELAVAAWRDAVIAKAKREAGL